MNFVIWLIVGAIIGWLASRMMKTDRVDMRPIVESAHQRRRPS